MDVNRIASACAAFGVGVAMTIAWSRIYTPPPVKQELPSREASRRPQTAGATTGQLQRGENLDSAEDPLRRVRKCEAIIQRRTSRMVVVIERCNQSHNYSAVLRTAEALGIHHVWLISPPKLEHDEEVRATLKKRNRWEDDAKELTEHVAYAKRASQWLSLRFFESSDDCVTALREDNRQIWVTDLSQGAVCLTAAPVELPDRLAVVFGTEATGASPTMLAAADKRIYLPLHGWADSLNLSVATALVLQRLLDVDETVVGDMSEDERNALRKEWYPKMAKTPAEADEYLALAEQGKILPLGDLRRVDKHRAGWLMAKVRRKNEAKFGKFDGIGFDSNTASGTDGAAATE